MKSQPGVDKVPLPVPPSPLPGLEVPSLVPPSPPPGLEVPPPVPPSPPPALEVPPPVPPSPPPGFEVPPPVPPSPPPGLEVPPPVPPSPPPPDPDEPPWISSQLNSVLECLLLQPGFTLFFSFALLIPGRGVSWLSSATIKAPGKQARIKDVKVTNRNLKLNIK